MSFLNRSFLAEQPARLPSLRMPEEQGAVCRLCSAAEGVLPADTLLTSSAGLTAHYFCLLFSSGLRQAGGEAEGLRGFLGADVLREVKRGARLKCVYCRKKGATGEGCHIQGGFFNFSPLNLAKSQSLYKIPYFNFFSPILLLGLGLRQIQGGGVKKTTLYLKY